MSMLNSISDFSEAPFAGRMSAIRRSIRAFARGVFRLTKVSAGKAGSGLTTADDGASNLVACVKSNTRCLAACPRGDTNVEYLCANHCRTKMNACKAKAKKPDSDADSP